MENLKLLLALYVRPADAMSNIIDRGSWIFAALVVLVVAILFFWTTSARLHETYRIPSFNEYYDPAAHGDDSSAAQAAYQRSVTQFNEASEARTKVPLAGDAFFKWFTFDPSTFYYPLFSISVFYVPILILLLSIFASIGNFGIVIRRDYAALATCSLMAWAAAHLPFAIVGAVAFNLAATPLVFLGLWIGSSLLFGIFMIFALRTVLGVNYGAAIVAVCLGWIAFTIGIYVFAHVSPWLLSPFLLFWLLIYFGSAAGGEVRGLGNAFRQKQNFKRFLHNATVNPKDADAHVQLGLIYQQRRQDSKALEHFEKAIEIDPEEIDANFNLGRIARDNGDLQKSLDYFAVVLEQDDKYALNEIWREVGATYLAANMFNEATDALEKFVDRRPVDPEGLYYCGKALQGMGNGDRAREMFAQAIDSVKSSPAYRRREIQKWQKLAEKEL